MNPNFDTTTALIIVDMQNDFVPGGNLPVQDGHCIVPAINYLIDLAHQAGALVIYTFDWHPADHCSFTAQGGTWPAHCVQETVGAALIKELTAPQFIKTSVTGNGHREQGFPDSSKDFAIFKGISSEKDAYSCFDSESPIIVQQSKIKNKHYANGTLFAAQLKEAFHIQKIIVVGLAFDFCVKQTAIDAANLGFVTSVIPQASKAVFPQKTAEILADLQTHQVTICDAPAFSGTSKH